MSAHLPKNRQRNIRFQKRFRRYCRSTQTSHSTADSSNHATSANSLPRSGGSPDPNPSPPIVSPNREYLRKGPETFGDFRLKSGKVGVRRRRQMREKPGLPVHSRVSGEARPNAALPGWRRSADRARLQPNSLLTGNFTGKFGALAVERQPLSRKTGVKRRLSSIFPIQIIREIES